MPRTYAIVSLLAGLLAASNLPAQTSYPMITHTSPVAVQRGKTTEVTVEGQMNFVGAYKVLFEGSGLSAKLTPGPATSANPPQKPLVRNVKLQLTVDAAAKLGVREFRLATPLGVSSIGQLLIVDDPVILESSDNNTPAKAHKITPPSVVCGRIEALEDVDHYRFRAEAGQTYTLEVHGARIQDKIHDLQKHLDPMVTLLDAEGRELAASDDTFFADPLLGYTFTRSGDYIVQVRDSKYDGDPRWVYSLHITPRPYLSHLYPMAVEPGRATRVEPVSPGRTVPSHLSVAPPSTPGLQVMQFTLDGAASNPVPLFVSPLPQTLEQEPNETPVQATRIEVPSGINGRIGARRDLDHFVFKGTKGRALRLEVKARRFGTEFRSGLDSVLDVMSLKGQILATNDDANGKDAALTFTPPADGDYVLRVRDLHSKGGPTFVYNLEVDWAVPDFTVRSDPDKAMIGPGSSTAWYVHVNRLNGFADPVDITLKGLPRGVTASPLTIPPTMTQGVVILTADANASLDAANVQVVGRGGNLVRGVTPNQEIYLPGGGRGRFDVGMQTVAVTEPSDILKVDVAPPRVTLKPGSEVRLDVTVQRRPDYDKGVSLDILLRHLGTVYGNPLPPGVTINEAKSKTLLGTGSKGHIVLTAAPNAAPIENVPISVLAHVSVNFVVKVSYSSPAIPVTVTR